MERALVLRRHFFGAESPEVLYACKALAEMCNLLAMSFLQQGTTSSLKPFESSNNGAALNGWLWCVECLMIPR